MIRVFCVSGRILVHEKHKPQEEKKMNELFKSVAENAMYGERLRVGGQERGAPSVQKAAPFGGLF